MQIYSCGRDHFSQATFRPDKTLRFGSKNQFSLQNVKMSQGTGNCRFTAVTQGPFSLKLLTHARFHFSAASVATKILPFVCALMLLKVGDSHKMYSYCLLCVWYGGEQNILSNKRSCTQKACSSRSTWVEGSTFVQPRDPTYWQDKAGGGSRSCCQTLNLDVHRQTDTNRQADRHRHTHTHAHTQWQRLHQARGRHAFSDHTLNLSYLLCILVAILSMKFPY